MYDFANIILIDITTGLYALLIFVALTYITEICVAIHEGKSTNKIDAKGITRKVMVFIIVLMSIVIDRFILGEGDILGTLTIMFFV